ncbi:MULTISPECIES: bifunctional riboflavin kinase/FAD synthetase [Gammaproteobacteria]|uniref:bifunctional riboflavin kinase/FAD synthetase n=1 Tax=Gammaproteobacteria TaxID=1236 RepID=UPI000DD0C99D|nr:MULTISPECIES: bifunctional riboflavin kinase/FAD synthetase [Gammaproteobacteria]RTE86139.1 bifunctional riboflavin kinase/FAD synthetase [Aliidiomarina sp. B3213]TCZ91492.1 bifunctional riboflavin kinase/FAD synthetase [Lysobacter sp. N42]
MKLIRGLHNIRTEHQHCVLTIGNFDGVHLGHRSVLSRVKESAEAYGVPAAVMIFEPQPLELFRPAQAPARLTRWREKYELMTPLGLEYLICTRFNATFSQQPAMHFIEHVLVEKLGVKHLVVGDDFRFGKGREGDFTMLQEAGKKFGFEVSDTASFRQSDARVSSTLIREALARGQFQDAAEMLGHPFHFSGRVSHGEKNGRKLGFPTANIPLKRLHSPLHGVYAVKVMINEQEWLGVANIGYRPTFEGQRAQVEVHIFDFAEDVYGQEMRVYPQHLIREEQKFESLQALQEQISKDKAAALAWFEKPI